MRKVNCSICAESFWTTSPNAKVCGDECREILTNKRATAYRDRNRDKAAANTRAWYEANGARKAKWSDYECEDLSAEWDKCRYITDEEREALVNKCKNLL